MSNLRTDCLMNRVTEKLKIMTKKTNRQQNFTFFAARCYASVALAVMRCLSVHPSICLCVCHVRTFCQKELTYLQNFFTIILVSPHQTAWQYSNGNPLTGASNAGGVGRNRDSGLTACCESFQEHVQYTLSCDRTWRVYNTSR